MRLAGEFRDFVLRGNVIDLAVAVVMGAAFGAVVTALVETFITPLIGAINGQPDFSALSFTLNSSVFNYGRLVNAVISFLIVALVVFLVIVKPANTLIKALTPTDDEPPPTKECSYCLSRVPAGASRCAFCTSELSASIR